MENVSLADIAAVTDRDGFGGNSMTWFLAILILLGGGGFGFNRGDYGQFATAASQQEILFGQQFQNIDNKIDRLANGLCDSTYALNNTIVTEGRESQKNVDALRFDVSQMIATTNANATANTQKILDVLAQNKIETLQGRINQLELQSAMCGVVRYPLQTTYTSGTNPFCNCNCNCGAV